ncbi:unnamed protein product [Enterobius vermicularis]|uniref:DNA primase n=1 Tax=Enterobius vermicularis TaxID=51028 RepID=A0A158QAG4_ENTVE|nr:unnamed protein product [Enterobius vermicularis]
MSRVGTKMSFNSEPNAYFSFREFAFILEGDVHLRYLSFSDPLEFERELCKASPYKLDIGAVYNYPPKENKRHANFHPVERELVFDIDLTDYDDVRSCCKEAKVCAKCWRWICIAIQVLEHHLRKVFGFKHLLWVFSGRRGIHCWVADQAARKLCSGTRSFVARYLSLVVEFQGSSKTVVMKGKKGYIHPLRRKSYEIIIESEHLERLVFEQGWMEDDKIDEIVSTCTASEVKLELEKIINDVKNEPSLEKRWPNLRRRLDPVMIAKCGASEEEVGSSDAIAHFQGFIMYHSYPRLDVNVTTGLNHLLKSPFCVHPKTGCVAVPITSAQAKNIDLANAPRIEFVVLLAEYRNASKPDMQQENRILGYKHTSLAPYVETFERFVREIVEGKKED